MVSRKDFNNNLEGVNYNYNLFKKRFVKYDK